MLSHHKHTTDGLKLLLWSVMSHVSCTFVATGMSVKAASMTLQGGRHTEAVLDECHKAEAGPGIKMSVPFAPPPLSPHRHM